MTAKTAPVSCSCPACSGAPEADFGAFVCAVREAAAKAKATRYVRTARLRADRHALREARACRVAATRTDYWCAAEIATFKRAAEIAIEGVLARRAARLAA